MNLAAFRDLEDASDVEIEVEAIIDATSPGSNPHNGTNDRARE